MKILFLPPTNAWSVETGYAKRWEEFMASLPAGDADFALANGLADADFVISQSVEEMQGNLKDVLRPLSHKDIMTFVWDISDRPTSRFSGFYCSLPKHLFDSRRHAAACYPIAFNRLIDEFPAHEAEMDFSFRGALTDTVRIKMVEALQQYQHGGTAMVQSTGHATWEFTDTTYASRNRSQAEFADLLRRSKFVLCPRGYGTGSMRLFEVMQAGRVPVIISDSYVLPGNIDWSACALRIPESRVADVSSIIQDNMGNWESMAKQARMAWEDNFSPAATLAFFGRNLSALSQSIAANSFSPWLHTAQMAAAVFVENARPLAGRAKQKVRGLIQSR